MDTAQVDEMFYQIPEILLCHEFFLQQLQARVNEWHDKQKIGDIFVSTVTILNINWYNLFSLQILTLTVKFLLTKYQAVIVAEKKIVYNALSRLPCMGLVKSGWRSVISSSPMHVYASSNRSWIKAFSGNWPKLQNTIYSATTRQSWPILDHRKRTIHSKKVTCQS